MSRCSQLPVAEAKFWVTVAEKSVIPFLNQAPPDREEAWPAENAGAVIILTPARL